MNVSDYDYHLPDELIATHPPKTRGASKLLVLRRGQTIIEHRMYANLPDLLRPGDVVVINDTKVIKARLITKNSSGNPRELLLLEKHGSDTDWHTHKALHKGSIKPGEYLSIANERIEVIQLHGNGIATVRCKNDLLAVAQKHGTVPLPPYMKRDATADDIIRYQTEFASHMGSVAAPTASLNLTEQIIKNFELNGIDVQRMTLHVGMGTFLPIRSDSLEGHKMHKEYFSIPTETVTAIRHAKQNGGRVITVGTTVTRALEYAAHSIMEGTPSTINGEADIFIYPGYDFKIVNGLVTNFHAPRSTVLMMAAAFAGWNNLKHTYDEAVKMKYAFLSYGDSMFIA